MASGFSVATNEHLIRSNLWSRQIKQLLLDDLYAMKFVRMIEEFPDGDTINIPSIGEAEVQDFAEGQAIRYNKLDTGNFTFSFDKYQYSAHSITEKFKRDSFYAQDVIASFAPRQHRAILQAIETRIFDRMNSGQTASNANTINGGDHRWVGSGTGSALALADFEKARYSLTKALVPLNNLVAVVDPSVAYSIVTQPNVQNLLTPSPMWQSLVSDSLVTGMKFRFNLGGFDVYVSNYLPSSITETVGSKSVSSTGVANFFFSAAGGDINPIIGGFRQQPTVHSKFNIDLQQEEFLTICEHGWKLYRPENLCTVLTDKAVVSF